MKIRTYLLIFALAILVPMIVFAVIAVLAFDRQQRTVVERGGVETARALMNALDRELTTSMTTLETLATVRSLERGDLAEFYDDARRVLASHPEWATIILATPDGGRLIDLSYPAGAELAPVVERESLEQVVRTRQPAVGTLTSGPLGRLAFPVRVPIMRGDEVVYVLTGVLKPSAVDEILQRQKLPEGWLGTIFDARRTVVARTGDTGQFLGRHISPEFSRVLDTAREGWAVTHTLEGVAVYTAFSRSHVTRWGVGLGIPRAAVDAPLRRSLWLIAGGGLAFLVAAVALSAVIGKRITGPVAALSAAATAFADRSEAPVPAAGGPAEIQAVARAFAEASALLRARVAERDEALARAHAAREEAEAANRAKDEFLAVLSHELRTPLNAVYGWARMLRMRTLGSAAAEHALDVIERNAAAQVRLVEELLDISRIVTGNMRLHRQPVDLKSVVDSALDSVRPAAEAKAIRMETSFDPAATDITGDPDRLRQVVWNLVSNAIKFTPSAGHVSVDVRRAGADVQLTVRDTGRGIAPGVLPYVFDRFRQGDSTSTREHGGLGLGLALVRHLVELHGGTVTAASGGAGAGASFVVTLPVGSADDSARSPESPRPALQGIRVLALDGSDQGRSLLAAIVGNAGGTVKTCSSAADALMAVAAFRPHVIVAAAGTPADDGYAFVRALRALPPEEGGLIPAAALTAPARADDARRVLESGFQLYVPQPVDPARLVAAVSTLAVDDHAPDRAAP